MSREYPDRPIVAVGAIIFRDRNILLIRRGKPPIRSDWSIPGGAQKVGETLEEALRREVREETGLDINILQHVKTIDFIERDSEDRPRFHYTLVDYWAEAEGEPKAGGDAIETRFVPVSDIGQVDMWDETRKVIDLAAGMRAAHSSEPHQTFRGHLRTALLAALFGAGAYGFVNALRTIAEMVS